MTANPEQRRYCDGSDHVTPGERIPGVDIPQRIDDRQVGGPHQLAGVEPQAARGDQRSLGKPVVEGDFPPGCVIRPVGEGDTQGDQQERRDSPCIRPRHSPVLPPEPDRERDRQGDRHRLGQHGHHQQSQRRQVESRARHADGVKQPAPPGRSRAQMCLCCLRVAEVGPAIASVVQGTNPEKRCGHVEKAGEQVLASDGPGHRLDMHGMNREYRGHDPGARHGETSQQAPQQQDVDHVQQHIDQVSAKRSETPKLVLQPECRVGDRPVVPFPLDVGRREPDVP